MRERGEAGFTADRRIVQENHYPEYWSVELAKQFAEMAPEGKELATPETPIHEVDLSSEGFGKVLIKDEGVRSSNPTGTMKDRLAKACANYYLYEARRQLQILAEHPNYKRELSWKRVMRYSIITAGNAGMALANAFKELNLPPPKLLLDYRTTQSSVDQLAANGADIYLADLEKNPFTGRSSLEDPLQPEQILNLTNNPNGFDITSANLEMRPPWVMYYYSMAENIFAQKPNEVYVPYGSGAVFDGVVLRQWLLGQGADGEENQIGRIAIFGGEPASYPSIADKLAAPAKPFAHYVGEELDFVKERRFTSKLTDKYLLSEDEIKAGYDLMLKQGAQFGLNTEPSAAAGLALYMKRWKAGLISKDSKVLVLNTGKGKISDPK